MSLPSYTKGYTPSAAGIQNASKYPVGVGKNYLIWGEQNGWVYDPYSDTYKADPKTQKSYYQNTGLMAEDAKQAGLGSTLGPLAAVSAVSAAVPSLVKEGFGLLHPATTATNVGNGAAMASQGAGAGFASGAGSSSGATAVGSAMTADGVPGTLMSDGSIAAGGEGAASASGGGLIGTGGSFFNTSGMIGPEGSFGAGNILGAAGGGLMIYDATQSSNKTRGIAEGALGGGLAGFSVGGPVGAVIGVPVGAILGATAHESTSDRTKRRYGELEDTDNQTFEAMKQKGEEWSLSGQDTWDIGDDKSQAPIDGMVNSYGVLKTFGPEWTQYSDEQRHNIVQGLVNADKINNKQGEYLIDDPTGAKEIAQSIAGAPAGSTPTSSSSSNSGTTTTTTTTTDAEIIPGLIGADDKKVNMTSSKKKASSPGVVAPIAVSLKPKAISPGGLIG